MTTTSSSTEPQLSILDMFTIGIGPSSSHTVGPMKAAADFLYQQQNLNEVCRLSVCCYGSLALTGQGHGTDKAILLGLMGFRPDNVDPKVVPELIDAVQSNQSLDLLGHKTIPFTMDRDLQFNTAILFDYHSNAMQFQLFNKANEVIAEEVYYSVGGGFIEKETSAEEVPPVVDQRPFPYSSAEALLALCKEQQCSIAELMLANEKSYRTEDEIHHYLDRIVEAMMQTINDGMTATGFIANSLNQKRRAPELARQLTTLSGYQDQSHCLYHLTCYAIAVGEQNAAGQVVVTSPTNGAAGIIPAVLMYYIKFFTDKHWAGDLRCFLLTAGGVGSLYKMNASISGAEMGCQGEVGVACSMAAAGLTAAMGGTPEQVEHAAEIAMEHNLGLTCDPVKGLVQIPCIERNALAAVKALNSALLALAGDGSHFVTLDQVIETMRQIGVDMKNKYKETAQGGLATVTMNEVEC
jgi:L-serine dehydratase